MRSGNTECGSIPPLSASIEAWCNGSTGDFGSPSPGSNPGASTNLYIIS